VRPQQTPIGMQLSRVTRDVSRAFDAALAKAGGSLPVWLVLLGVKSGGRANQRELAEAVGIHEATLTHHLNAMEKDGLLTRTRDPDNRRVHVVALTDAGEQRFDGLRAAAMAFDRRLRRGISADQLSALRETLDRLGENAD
jgi:MarR family transcriptional regulator, transcriptional regulator for hemolysin